jgi:hypothetical protein
LIPCHNKINGVTTKAEIMPVNIKTTRVINNEATDIVIKRIPRSIFHGRITNPSPTKPKRIRENPRTNLKSLTTRKQISKDARIIIRYVITIQFFRGP